MPYTVKLRITMFERAATLAGFASDYALAHAMGVNRSTIGRVRSGNLQPGAAFIAGALVALAPMTFGDLFEVGTGRRLAAQPAVPAKREGHSHVDHDKTDRTTDRSTGLCGGGVAGRTCCRLV
ncbi:hypothetical protein AB0I60_35920 [Actinosynnema sp. NPDC050436]|uniref:hypothetical protein n=1 Tax=Actinosynnema sp. NPDC050436 TaxID=3155659 RepID=UPI0033FDF38F